MNNQLDELKSLFMQNKDSMPIETRQVFQAILFELDKGNNMDQAKLSYYLSQLGVGQ